MESAVLEVGGEIVNLGGAVVVEEEVDTTVHEVEVLVSDLNTPPSSSSKCVEEEDSIQDEEIKEQVESPETELQDESQVEDEVDTPTTWLVYSYILCNGKTSILNLYVIIVEFAIYVFTVLSFFPCKVNGVIFLTNKHYAMV